MRAVKLDAHGKSAFSSNEDGSAGRILDMAKILKLELTRPANEPNPTTNARWDFPRVSSFYPRPWYREQGSEEAATPAEAHLLSIMFDSLPIASSAVPP